MYYIIDKCFLKYIEFEIYFLFIFEPLRPQLTVKYITYFIYCQLPIIKIENLFYSFFIHFIHLNSHEINK